MKKRFFYLHVGYLLASAVMFSSCSKFSSGFSDRGMGFQDQDQEGPAMNFNETLFDFGVVNQGQKVNHVFRFKNIGQSPLLIYDAKGSCGCTIPNHSNGPIMPGDSGVVKVTFDSEGLAGFQQKTVTLSTNTMEKEEKLYIRAFVKQSEK